MRAIVTRHYKTVINVADQIMGWGDAPPAEDWEPDLAYVDQILQSACFQFDSVHTSTLARSARTGEYFAATRGIEKLEQHAELREVNYGSLYRKSKNWVEQHVPEYKSDPDFVFPQGESFREMQRRSVRCFENLARRYDGKTILVVAHAGVIRGLICHCLGLAYGSNLKQRISHRYVGRFRFEGGVFNRYAELGEPSGFVSAGLIGLIRRLQSLRHP